MKAEDPSALEAEWFYHKSKVLPKGDGSYTQYAARGRQKYLCRKCRCQWATETPPKERTPNCPSCPVCGKAMYLHHSREHYDHYTCSDKKCRHSVFVSKPAAIQHIRVQSFHDDITNNLIACFNKQFKAWYKSKQGFSSFASANSLISLFVFRNFVRALSALNALTPAQCAGPHLSKKA